MAPELRFLAESGDAGIIEPRPRCRDPENREESKYDLEADESDDE
jgi:hypothetical protein